MGKLTAIEFGKREGAKLAATGADAMEVAIATIQAAFGTTGALLSRKDTVRLFVKRGTNPEFARRFAWLFQRIDGTPEAAVAFLDELHARSKRRPDLFRVNVDADYVASGPWVSRDALAEYRLFFRYLRRVEPGFFETIRINATTPHPLRARRSVTIADRQGNVTMFRARPIYRGSMLPAAE